MAEQNAGERREARRRPRMQREVPQVDRGRIDAAAHHDLEGRKHRRQDEAAGQLRAGEDSRFACRPAASGAHRETEAHRRRHARGYDAGEQRPAEQQLHCRAIAGRRVPWRHAERDPQQRAAAENQGHDREREHQLASAVSRSAAAIEHRSVQQEHREREDRDGDPRHGLAVLVAGCGDRRERHRRVKQRRAVGSGDLKTPFPGPLDRGRLWVVGAERHGPARRGHLVRTGRQQDRRGGRRGQLVLGRDRADARLRSAADRLEVHEAQAERGRGHEQRRRGFRAIGREIGRASGPGARHTGKIVNGDRQERLVRGHASPLARGRIEQRARAILDVGVGGHGGRDIRIARDAMRDGDDVAGHRRDLAADVLFEPRSRRRVARAEPVELEEEADQDDRRRRGAAPGEHARGADASFPREPLRAARRPDHVVREYSERARRV